MISDTLSGTNGGDRVQAVHSIMPINNSASNSTSRRELLDQCKLGTEREENIHDLFLCPACLGCKTCCMVRKLKCVSLSELSEQFHLQSIIKFIPVLGEMLMYHPFSCTHSQMIQIAWQDLQDSVSLGYKRSPHPQILY